MGAPRRGYATSARGCSREGAPTVQLEKSRFLINNFVIKRFFARYFMTQNETLQTSSRTVEGRHFWLQFFAEWHQVDSALSYATGITGTSSETVRCRDGGHTKEENYHTTVALSCF